MRIYIHIWEQIFELEHAGDLQKPLLGPLLGPWGQIGLDKAWAP